MCFCRLRVNASLASVAALAFATVLEIAQIRGSPFACLGRFCLALFLFLGNRVWRLEPGMAPTYQNKWGARQLFRNWPLLKSERYPKVRRLAAGIAGFLVPSTTTKQASMLATQTSNHRLFQRCHEFSSVSLASLAVPFKGYSRKLHLVRTYSFISKLVPALDNPGSSESTVKIFFFMETSSGVGLWAFPNTKRFV